MTTAPETEPRPDEVQATVDEFVGWVTELATVAGILAAQVDDVAPALTFDEAIRLLDGCRGSIGVVEATGTVLGRRIADQWTAGQDAVVEVEGVVVSMTHHAKDRREWDHDALMREVIKKKLADRRAKGDPAPDPYTIGRWVLDAALPSYWRIHVLNELGIDEHDYCRLRDDKPKVKTRRRARAKDAA